MKKSILLVVVLTSVLTACETPTKETKEKTETQSQTVPQDPIAVLNDKIKASPNDGDLYLERAEIKKQRNDFQGAIYDIDRALRIDSVNADYLMFKADVYKDSKQIIEHKNYLEEVLEKNDQVLDAYYDLGFLYLASGNYEKVYELANKALKIDVHYAPAYFIKGLAYQKEGKSKLAFSSFNTAVEQDPGYYDAYVELGLMYAEANDPLALAYYDNAISIDSSKVHAMYNKGMYLQEHGEYREALELYDRLLHYNASFYNAYYNKGYIYLEYLEKNDSAAYNFGMALQIFPQNYRALYNRGLAHERTGELTLAEADYRMVLKMKPDYDLAAEGLSRVLDR